MINSVKKTTLGLLLAVAPSMALSSNITDSKQTTVDSTLDVYSFDRMDSGTGGPTKPEPLPPGANAQAIYEALDVGEWRLAFLNPATGAPRIGTETFEKSVDGFFCRRTAPVVPNPEFRYECYSRLRLSDWKAKKLFKKLPGSAFRVAFLDPNTGEPRVGSTTLEKSNGSVICHKTAPVVPNPVFSFACYRNLENIR